MGNYSAISGLTNQVVNQPDSVTSSSGVMQAIKNAASQTGVDFSYLVKKASQESGFDPIAKAATSSASGLFQFTSQTWLSMVKKYGAQYGLADYASKITADANGHLSVSDPSVKKAILALRNNPQCSAEMACELDKLNATSLQRNVGGKIGGTELYLAHFLGASGASEFLNTMHDDPTATGADVLPDAAAANPSVFYTSSGEPRSLRQIYQHFAQKFGDGTVQLAKATTPATPAYTIAINNPMQNSVSAIYAPAAFKSGINVASATTSPSTIFTAMLLGQAHDMTENSPLPTINSIAQNDAKKRNAIDVLSSLV